MSEEHAGRMNLPEASYLIRFLTRLKFPAAMMVEYDEAGRAHYRVASPRDQFPPDQSIDLAQLGVALWLRGFRLILTPNAMLMYEKGEKLQRLPMADWPEDVVEGEAFEEPNPHANPGRSRQFLCGFCGYPRGHGHHPGCPQFGHPG